MSRSMVIQSQLLATKFFIPVAAGTLISRPRLTTLLAESLKCPLTLISAPAGFGKTMLLATWAQSQLAHSPLIGWVSLDEEDNDPRLFWTYALSALDQQQPERFTPLLKYLQSPQSPPLRYVLTALTNLLVDSAQHFVLILDDYHVIQDQEVHATLTYLVEHLPAHLHIILSTRTDPPLPFAQLRAWGQVLEVRTEQLRCTAEETGAFFHQVMGIELPDETIQEVTARTEGWLVCLHLLGLSLPEHADPATLLEEIRGDQRYILDYLTKVVLGQQPQEVQIFLLSTCVLEQLNASLCDAVMQQSGSRQMLQRLEQANLFVVSLDKQREWYRYHALFAEALRYLLKRRQGDLIPILHHRASRWYAQHGSSTQAILHACNAKEWQWASDLIEGLPLISLAWGAGEHELVLLHQWLEQLPTEVVHSRPRLCLACTQILWAVASPTTLETWFEAAETKLMASLTIQTNQDSSQTMLIPQERQHQENLLGEVLAFRAILRAYEGDGQSVLVLCQRALALLRADNFLARVQVAYAQLQIWYYSSANNAVAAVECGLQAGSFAQQAENTALALMEMAFTAMCMIGAGRLHEAQQLSEQAMLLGRNREDFILPEVGYPALFQAEILREWNELDAARSLIQEAISLCKQAESIAAIYFLLYGYAVLLRICLSCGELDAACSVLREFEGVGMRMNQPTYIQARSFFITIDQVRLWLACGELDQAGYWVKKLDLAERQGTPFAREREEMACIRVLLAAEQPAAALQRLEPVLRRAMTGLRWGHVIEMRLLQALAYQMEEEEMQALDALSEAVRLAEPEGYIRCFVEESIPMEALLSQLREQQGKQGPTPYLDTLLAAFLRESKVKKRRPKRVGQRAARSNRYRTL